MDTQEDIKLDTQEDLKREEQKLLSELSELKLRMKRGEDVTQQFKRLNDKFKLIEKIDEMIKMQNELLKNQNQQDNKDVNNQKSSLEAAASNINYNNTNTDKDKRTQSPSTLKRLIYILAILKISSK